MANWLFNLTFRTSKMHEECSAIIPLNKNKHDNQNCNENGGIKMRIHTMKIQESVVEMRMKMRRGASITENKFGFMPGRSTTSHTSRKVIHLVRRLMQ